MANVIEVLLRTKDQTASGINKFKSSISGLKTAIGGLVASFALGAMIRNIEEAEAATAQLDAAFKATGANARVTRASLDDLASSIQRTTTYSDDLVKQAQSILLTFRQVRGEAFERTIKVSTDLSARLGVDLVSAVRQVGRAINDPIQGLSLLRRSGIQFTDSQTEMIKRLVETGEAARAQNLILGELEARFKGSAAAARDTLGGALVGLKNSFGDLFESSKEGTSGIVDGINDLSKTLSDPQLKEGIDFLVTGLLKIAGAAAKAVGFLGQIAKSDAVKNVFKASPLVAPFADLIGLTGDAPKKGGGVGHGGSRIPAAPETFDDIPAAANIEEVRVTARRRELTATEQFYADLNELSRTSTENQIADFHRVTEAINELERERIISKDTAEARRGEALDDLLPEFDLEKIRGLKKEVKTEVTEIGEIMKGVWQGVGHSIQSTLSDAIYEGKLSLRSLVDIARRAFADIASALIASNLKKLIGGIFGLNKGVQTGVSDAGFVSGLIGAAFGFAAGGGSQRGPRIVGEDGPELDMGSGRIYNRRQLAFAGMGGNVTYAPVTNVQIIERDNPDQMKREIFQAVAVRNAQQQKEFIRTLQRSGVELKG